VAYASLYNVDAIRAATVAARDGDAPVERADTTEQRIADLIEADFGCHKAQVRKLVVLLGHELPEPNPDVTKDDVPKAGTLVNYRGAMVLILGHDSDGDANYTSPDGTDRSYISERNRWTYATDAELDAFAAA
jgi:hypothetical protein